MEPHDDRTHSEPANDSTIDAPATSDVPATDAVETSDAAAAVDGPKTDSAVAAALTELARVDELALGDRPDAFGRIHAGLQRALSGVDGA